MSDAEDAADLADTDNMELSATDIVRCTDCENILDLCDNHIQYLLKVSARWHDADRPTTDQFPRSLSEYHLTRHAKNRMAEREISRRRVSRVISDGVIRSAAGPFAFRFSETPNMQTSVGRGPEGLVDVVVNVAPETVSIDNLAPIVTVYVRRGVV